MTIEQHVADIDRKLNLLMAALLPAEDIRESELEAQYLEALREASVNPALLRRFVQQHPVWVAGRNQKAA